MSTQEPPLTAGEYIAVMKALEGELRFTEEGGEPDPDTLSALAKFRAGVQATSPLPEGLAGAVWVESICGYQPREKVWADRTALLVSVGFVRFCADDGGAELFLLPGAWAAKGELAELGKARDVDAIVGWVMQRVRPGVVCVGTKRWGLSID